MTFFPRPGDCIVIENIEFCFVGNPNAPSYVFGTAGTKATVYKLIAKRTGTPMALKVFLPEFSKPRTAENAKNLFEYSDLPGLQICERTVLTPENHPKLLSENEDLKYSVLMPWMQGNDWRSCISGEKIYSKEICKQVAKKTISILSIMESKGIAHCDLSGGNIKIEINSDDPADSDIYLVDLEDIFAPNFPAPEDPSYGTPGYNHKEYEKGVWNPLADRFSSAVLISEILCRCEESIVKNPEESSFFSEKEMQSDCERYRDMKQSLHKNWGKKVEEAFSEAWFSEKLSQCPRLIDWQNILDGHQHYDDFKEIIERRIIASEYLKDSGDVEQSISLLEETLQVPYDLAFQSYLAAKLQRAKQFEKLYNSEAAQNEFQELLAMLRRNENLIDDIEGMALRANRLNLKEI